MERGNDPASYVPLTWVSGRALRGSVLGGGGYVIGTSWAIAHPDGSALKTANSAASIVSPFRRNAGGNSGRLSGRVTGGYQPVSTALKSSGNSASARSEAGRVSAATRRCQVNSFGTAWRPPSGPNGKGSTGPGL